MSVSPSVIRNVCPVDLHPLVEVPVTTAQALAQTVAAARAAQRGWAELGLDTRGALLTHAAKGILARRQEVLELLHDEAGKTPGDVLMGEALGALQYVQDWVRVARPHLRPRRLDISKVAFPGKRGTIDLLPRGVVAVIAPWNFPLANFFKPVFAALICGNAVVLKPSELSPRMGAWFARVLGEVLPAGVLSVVQGQGEVGAQLVRSGVDAVTFTGSTATGREVAKACAEALIPLSVELGGKDAAVVLADCELDRTVAGVMYWALANAGQSCGAIERVFVEDAVADRFVDALAAAVARLRVTPEARTSDVGPLANQRQLEVVERHVADALAQGAVAACGGRRTGHGFWFEPTVLDRCTPSMLVMREPTFGPVIAVCRVPDAEAAVAAVNDCAYGLNASVWSRDLTRAAALARRFEVGTAFVNNHGFTGAMPAAPWTGVKSSGYGVANSFIALHHYTRPRTLVVDTSSGADAWWFPMDFALEELGHRLSEAQLGNVLAAVKVPLLLAQRKRAVLDFVRTGARLEPRAVKQKVSGRLSKVRRALTKLAVHPEPRLTRRERAWGTAAMEAIFHAEPGVKGQSATLSSQAAEAHLEDAYEALPLTGRLGVRAALATLGVAVPAVLKRRLTTLEKLPVEERLDLLNRLYQSDVYLLRQMTVLMKLTGSLGHATTTRIHEALGYRPPEPNTRAPAAGLRS